MRSIEIKLRFHFLYAKQLKYCILGHPSSMAGLPKDIKPPQLLLSILDALSTYTDKQRE